MNIKYFAGAILAFPLLPIMYFQGKKIREKVPRLPEARGKEGFCHYPNTSNTLHLLTLGESTIAGVGVATHDEGFTGTLARELSKHYHTSVSWKVAAKSGYTARNLRTKMLPKLNIPSADLIMIGLGGNDAFTLNTPKRWKRDIRELIVQVRVLYPNAIIVFCNMPPIKEFPAFTPLIQCIVGNLVEILGEELTKVTASFKNVYFYSRKITLIDWIHRLGVNATEADFFSDGIHPSPLAYQTWAKDVAREICEQSLLPVTKNKDTSAGPV